MTTQPPTVQSLQNWQDAFIHYPLPAVRTLERDLRKNIEENRSRLRSLVGASYRDLLGTAERIIEMNGQMGTLERGLGDMGKRCDARVLERAGGNWARMKSERATGGSDADLAVAAQTKVLRGCLDVVGRVVKGRGDALLGAKVLVLARLLVKSIGESTLTPPILDELRKRLLASRKRLLAYIERSMARAGADKTALASTLCAYALVTSSTPKEVLRHFLQVRFRQLESEADSPSGSEVTGMLDLYSRTLLDTKDLFPRRFADALSQLSKAPLMRDAQVNACYELSLDVYGQWIADDIRSFTPWVRHEQVTSSEATDALASWTSQAHACLLSGVEQYLERQTDLFAVVESRHAVLSKFMALSSRLRSKHHAKAITDIREAFLSRMKSVVSDSAALTDLELETSSSVAAKSAEHDSLWNMAREEMDLSAGAHAFRKSVTRRRRGRDASIDPEIAKLDAWVKRIERSFESIELARSRKWDDDLDFDVDDLDDGEQLLEKLSKQDPADATRVLSSAVEATVKDIRQKIESSGESTADPAFALRMWREVDVRMRSLQARLALSPASASLQGLYRNLSTSVSRRATDEYVQASASAARVATTLWDGDPALPVQPTPVLFRFLTSLHHAMSEAGDDLWSVGCLVELRKVINEEMERIAVAPSGLSNGIAGDDAGEEAGNANGGQVHEVKQSTNKEGSMQTLFDRLYLRQVFPLEEGAGMAATLSELQRQADVDEASRQRMERSAREYWRRTHLLFGLLADRAKE